MREEAKKKHKAVNSSVEAHITERKGYPLPNIKKNN